MYNKVVITMNILTMSGNNSNYNNNYNYNNNFMYNNNK